MGYPIEIRLAPKQGFHTPAEAKKHYGRYSRDGVTIHWWNLPSLVTDADHDNITNYILGKAQRGIGSVGYVVSNKKITLVVNAKNVSWASQKGNPTTVAIECSPHLNAEGYKKLGWLINELFNPTNGLFRKKPGYWKHSDWYETACPGTISMTKIKASVKRWEDGKWEEPKPVPPPKPVPTTPINTFTLWKDGGEYVFNKDTWLYDLTAVRNWDTVKKIKSFKKGDRVIIAGGVHNKYIDRTYYITRYSFDSKKATGFHPNDLDVYVAPRPIPKPPVVPVEPTEPDPIDENSDKLNKILEIVQWIKNLLSRVFKGE